MRAGGIVALWALIGMIVAMTGCTTALKQGYYELRGAKAEIHLVNDVPVHALDKYQGVTFSHATTDLNARLCPPLLRSSYDQFAGRLEQQLSPLMGGGTPRLTVDTQVLYYQRKGILGSGQFLTRVRMRDGGSVVVDALVNTRTKSFRDGAADDMAEASVTELGRWLAGERDLEFEGLE